MAADPRRLTFLLAVHRAGGVLAAAHMLRITPSAVSQQIARLEAEEGVALLDRGPRGVTLTPAGKVLVEAAERIETELVEARKTISAMSDQLTGRVAVGSFQTAIRAVVAPVAAYLSTTLPGIELDIQEHEPTECDRLLRAGELDIVLHEQDVTESPHHGTRGMKDIVLLSEPWRVVLPEAHHKPRKIADLADAVWIGAQPDTAAARALDRLARALGKPLTTRHSYYDFDVALSLVRAGLGVAVIPALALFGQARGTPTTTGEDVEVAPDGVAIARLPGLGSRRLLLRHRASRREPRKVVGAVVDAMVAASATINFD